ncbi:MAG: VWA domain-containing protein [Oscillospiraceae bacterium]|nr:VWA domain-containing protein [Oscillospiraceae bacterium]
MIVSLIAGLVAGVVVALLYGALADVWGRPLLIGFLFVVFALIVCGALYGTMVLSGDSDEEFLFFDGKGKILIGLALSVVILFGLGMLLEFLYDVEGDTKNQPSSYVFLLDESGSMEGNDSNGERHSAVNMLMETMPSDVPFAVYMFANRAVCVREMAPITQGKFHPNADTQSQIGEGTMIKDGLQTVLNDVNNGNIPNPYKKLRVILLTDGASSDMGALIGSNSIIKAYKRADVTISCVGLGNVDERLLNKLADKTGGVYVHIEDAAQLAQGFTAATVSNSDRDLLSMRSMKKLNALYMVLRIVFLVVLGAAFAFMKSMAIGSDDATKLIMLVGVIAAFIGALLLEVLAQAGAAPWIGQIIYFLLIAITPVEEVRRNFEIGNIPIYY